jgi:hypothetical protein
MSLPIQIIKQFKACFDDENEIKKFINSALDITLSSPYIDSWTSEDRSDFIFFFRQVEQLIDAIYIILPSIISICEI